MFSGLAYAQQPDSGDSNLTVMVVGIAVICGICGLAFAIVGLAHWRRHRQREIIIVAAIFWAILSTASVAYALLQQSKWSGEYLLRLQSGYYTPAQAQNDAPQLPWNSWTILAGAYAALMAWSLVPPRAGSQ
jgi:hypothetical protein